MFEIESKNPEEILIKTSTKNIFFDIGQGVIKADIAISMIEGPGEFEIGEATIRGISVSKDNSKTIYDVEINGVHIGMIGDFEGNLDDLGVSDILCTSSVKAVREINPKIIIATGNVDGMVTELKLTANTSKRLKIKKADDLPKTQEVVVLN